MHPLRITVPMPVSAARAALEGALAAEGFGILTEIDLQATFEARLGVRHEAHRILGVCNPHLAKRALDLDRDVAGLLPCTITLRDTDDGTEVSALDPEAVFTLAAPATRVHLEELAREVGARLGRALHVLAGAPHRALS
jgi:uncharacterized protein (DUF302 family)